MRFLLLASALTSLVTSVAAGPTVEAPVSYDGHKVFRIKTGSKEAAVREKLASFKYDEWNHDASTLDIVLSGDQIAAFNGLGLDSKVIHENLGNSIKAESAVATTKWKRQAEDLSWFDSYHTYGDHIKYFEKLQQAFPNNSKIVSTGKSVYGRNIFGIQLFGASGPGKPAVLYHATVHAREWIAAPVVEYIAVQLISGYKAKDPLVTQFLDSYDFFIFPVVNPDGFVHSQNVDRLWRKNRQGAPRGADPTCIGRDINRNWEFAWGTNPRGASTNPCAQTYQGQKASDTPENQGLDKFVRQLRDGPGIKLYIDFHSYGQYILSPYGFNETLYAPELGKWTNAAQQVSETIRDSSPARTTFTFGPSGATLYATTGAAPDHVYSIGGADFSYTIELRDTGDYGFVLPPTQILPTVKEQWEGQKVLLNLLDEVFFDGRGPAIAI